MAKKKARGRPKGSTNPGPTSSSALKQRIGAAGMKQVAEIHSKYSKDVVLFAARSFPKLPSQTERLLAELPENEARSIRAKLLSVL